MERGRNYFSCNLVGNPAWSTIGYILSSSTEKSTTSDNSEQLQPKDDEIPQFGPKKFPKSACGFKSSPRELEELRLEEVKNKNRIDIQRLNFTETSKRVFGDNENNLNFEAYKNYLMRDETIETEVYESMECLLQSVCDESTNISFQTKENEQIASDFLVEHEEVENELYQSASNQSMDEQANFATKCQTFTDRPPQILSFKNSDMHMKILVDEKANEELWENCEKGLDRHFPTTSDEHEGQIKTRVFQIINEDFQPKNETQFEEPLQMDKSEQICEPLQTKFLDIPATSDEFKEQMNTTIFQIINKDSQPKNEIRLDEHLQTEDREQIYERLQTEINEFGRPLHAEIQEISTGLLQTELKEQIYQKPETESKESIINKPLETEIKILKNATLFREQSEHLDKSSQAEKSNGSTKGVIRKKKVNSKPNKRAKMEPTSPEFKRNLRPRPRTTGAVRKAKRMTPPLILGRPKRR